MTQSMQCCSWARLDRKHYKKRDGKPVVEVLLYMHAFAKKAYLVGNLVEPDDPIPYGLGKEISTAVARAKVWHEIW